MLKAGDRFERYKVEAVLGQGGMGAVYCAHDERLDRRVALKVMTDAEGESAGDEAQAEGRARLLREARAAAKLDHPNAVSIYDVGEVDGAPFIAMELVEGKTLRAFVADASVPLGERLRWLRDAARALGEAHRRGIVHRDVKPDNVMVRGDGRVKVLDFGIARRAASDVDPSAPTNPPSALGTLTAKGAFVGTPHYMAPEQIRCESLDGRADQFAWGLVAYELLAGRHPFAHPTTMRVFASILTDAPPPLREAAPEVPAEVIALIERTLAKSPGDRLASMEEIAEALEPHAADGGGERRRSSPPLRAPSSAPAPVPARAPVHAAPRASPRGGPLSRRYTTAQVREVFARAVERQPERGGYSDSDLIEAAREAGIEEEAVRDAARALSLGEHAAAEEREARLASRQRFMRHAAIWLSFSVFFFLLDLTSQWMHGSFWPKGWFMFPALAWGVVLACHAAAYMFPVPRSQKERARRARKLRRRVTPAEESAIEEGVNVILTTPPRVRVATDDDGEAELEAEREMDEPREVRRARTAR